MTLARFTPRARRELLTALGWVAEENPDAAEALLRAALDAAGRVTEKPGLARLEPRLAPPRFRFWSLRGHPWLLVIDTASEPPVVARFVHQSRDLPAVLGEP